MNYDAFGNMVSTPPAQPEPMQYVGQNGYYTDATGFVYVRNRYYDPVNGTWLSKAPVAMQQAGEHACGYAQNYPVGHMDPGGLAPIGNMSYSIDLEPPFYWGGPIMPPTVPILKGCFSDDWRSSTAKGYPNSPICMRMQQLRKVIPYQPWLGFPAFKACNEIR